MPCNEAKAFFERRKTIYNIHPFMGVGIFVLVPISRNLTSIVSSNLITNINYISALCTVKLQKHYRSKAVACQADASVARSKSQRHSAPQKITPRKIMQHIMLFSKLHRVTVTEADLHYEGSCGIDENLLNAAKMHEFEKIELYNINNSQRFSTYTIKAPRDSRVISLNGAAARRSHVGDHLIICTYGAVDSHELANHVPTVVLVGEQNRIKGVKK